MIAKPVCRWVIAAILLSSTAFSAVNAGDECSWEQRASLPAPVQRYLSSIFQKPDERYRPYRFDLDAYINGFPGYVSKRVQSFEDIDKTRPYALRMYNGEFPAGLRSEDAFTEANSPFYRYWRSGRQESSYLLANYNSSEFLQLGSMSFIGFDRRYYKTARAQADAIIKQNAARFRKGQYAFELAGDACLNVTQYDGDRLTAILTLYDSEKPAEPAARRINFLECRDKYYARILGLRHWPTAKPYAPSVEQLSRPDYDLSKLPPRPLSLKPEASPPMQMSAANTGRSPNKPLRQTRFSPTLYQPESRMRQTSLASSPGTGRNLELLKDQDAQKIIAFGGGSDFTGVCRAAMQTYTNPIGWNVWALERLNK